jgi:hypothetical protein
VLVGQESHPLRRRAGKEETLGDETIAVEGGILAGEGDQLVTVEGKPADPFEARQPSGSLRLQQVTTVHLVQAVRVERQPNDLFDEPVSILRGEMLPQPGLEVRDDLLVDLADDRLDGWHDQGTSRG